MNNSVFGKTVENLRKRADVKLVTDKKKLTKLTSKPTYVTSKIFKEKVATVHTIKETLTLNGTAYVSMCILDLNMTLRMSSTGTPLWYVRLNLAPKSCLGTVPLT